MALVLNDRVRETTTTTGTGAVALGGAVSGFETFAAGIGNSNTVYYAIVHRTAAEFEVGLGTLDGDSSDLTRTTPISSSNSDSAVDFSSGTKDVFCTLPASKTVFEDASGHVTLPHDLFIEGGLIDLKNDGGAVSQIKFYCESSNAHAQTLIGAPHSEAASNTLTLPSTGGDAKLVSATSTATLTNKTLTTPTITSPAITGASTITTADNTDTLSLISTDADASSGPNLRMYRNSSSPADSDILGVLEYEGRNDNSEDVRYVQITSFADDVSDGEEDGSYFISTMLGGTLRNRINVRPTETVFNEESQNVDFRIESDSNANAIFVDASTDRVGIFTSSPTVALDVTGDVKISGDLTVTGDDIVMGTNTSGHIMVADGTNFNPVAVSGDVSIAANGAVTIASTAVETSMIAADAITEAKIADNAVESEHINDNVISGQSALTSGLATTDELLISDGGTIKKMDVSVITEVTDSSATALAIALG